MISQGINMEDGINIGNYVHPQWRLESVEFAQNQTPVPVVIEVVVKEPRPRRAKSINGG
jgi:hypothetical protein